ncbi:hypothetical protein [Pedobacter sp. GR22-6]|uniref:hypothetical protein n=1 Tax=Pedobacter sp. GR22-6 TaxID=3127957 RepID=UPI00307D07D0
MITTVNLIARTFNGLRVSTDFAHALVFFLFFPAGLPGIGTCDIDIDEFDDQLCATLSLRSSDDRGKEFQNIRTQFFM